MPTTPAKKADTPVKAEPPAPPVQRQVKQSPHVADLARQHTNAPGVTIPVAAHTHELPTDEERQEAAKAEQERRHDNAPAPCEEHFPGGWGEDDSVTSVGCEHGTWTRQAPAKAESKAS